MRERLGSSRVPGPFCTLRRLGRVGLPVLVALAAGCDSAEVGRCGADATLQRFRDTDFCVYEVGAEGRSAADVTCGRDTPHRVVTRDHVVCTSGPDELEELPPELCSGLSDSCAPPEADAGPRDAGPRDADTTDMDPRDGGGADAGPADAEPRDAAAWDMGPRDGGPAPGGGRYVVTVFRSTAPYETTVWLLDALEGAPARNLSAELDALHGVFDGIGETASALSVDGRWIAGSGGRRCGGGSFECLHRAPADDLSALEILVGTDDSPLVGWDPEIDPSGDLVVFGVPNDDGVTVARRKPDGRWELQSLTSSSPYRYHATPALSPDASHVLMTCGDAPYQERNVCEVAIDGSDFHLRVDRLAHPMAADGPDLETPRYAPDGSVVFGARWGGRQRVFRSSEGGALESLTPPGQEDATPCVLPDGRIAVVTLPDEGVVGVRAPGGTLLYAAPALPVFDVWFTAVTGCGL